MIHLAMIGFVVAEAWCDIVCPLTTWENQLRSLAGDTTYEGDFIANFLHDALFFEAEPWVFTLAYSLFGLAVLRVVPRNSPATAAWLARVAATSSDAGQPRRPRRARKMREHRLFLGRGRPETGCQTHSGCLRGSATSQRSLSIYPASHRGKSRERQAC